MKSSFFSTVVLFFMLLPLTAAIAQQRSTQTQRQGQSSGQNIDPSQIDPSQIATINIDNLSDAQLRMFYQRFESSGLSEQELEMALRSRGMPAIQIQKLKDRIAKIRTSAPRSGTGYDRARTREQPATTETDLFQTLTTPYEDLLEEKEKEKLSKIFGYRLFNSEVLTFEPSLNVPTPKDYTLGPGDEVVIDVWGASEQTYQEMITPDGYIKIANLGPIFLNGLTIERASERVKERLSQIYSGLKGSQPNTFAQVSLGQVRTIRVSVVGEALRPGTFNVSSLATIGNILYLSGGPNLSGSLRNIELIRGGEKIYTFDAYDFLIKGALTQNLRLQDQDIVRVLPYESRVEVLGEAKRPGIYEAKDGETFEDLVGFAGGFTENAYSGMIKVKRNNGVTREFLDLKKEEFSSAEPQNGDVVSIEGIVNRFENRVQIRGAVFREGEFQLSEGLTLLGLIEKAQGLRGDAFMERATIYRTRDDYTSQVISLNLREVLKGESDDIALAREDVVNISSVYDLKEEYYLQVYGEVRNPGVFPYIGQMTVEDLLLKAGGLRESASKSQIEVARRIRDISKDQEINETAEVFTFSISESLGLTDEASKFVLQPFDQVYVRRSPAYQQQINVRLDGEVNYPGLYAIKKKDERISDMIKRAGGITVEGYAKGGTLIRRTEFNPAKPDDMVRLENLKVLKEAKEKTSRDISTYTLSETEELLLKRLEGIEETLEEYELQVEEGVGRERMNLKQMKIRQLMEEDSLLREEDLVVQYETIGIDLERILQNPGSKYDLIMEDGDIISIPKQLQTVRLRGEFLYPITARYDDKNSFGDYVSQAGGFTEDARKSKAYIIYANGSVDRTRKFLFWNNYPRVSPGAEIIVPTKPEKRGISAAEVMAISTGLASLTLIITRILDR